MNPKGIHQPVPKSRWMMIRRLFGAFGLLCWSSLLATGCIFDPNADLQTSDAWQRKPKEISSLCLQSCQDSPYRLGCTEACVVKEIFRPCYASLCRAKGTDDFLLCRRSCQEYVRPYLQHSLRLTRRANCTQSLCEFVSPSERYTCESRCAREPARSTRLDACVHERCSIRNSQDESACFEQCWRAEIEHPLQPFETCLQSCDPSSSDAACRSSCAWRLREVEGAALCSPESTSGPVCVEGTWTVADLCEAQQLDTTQIVQGPCNAATISR